MRAPTSIGRYNLVSRVGAGGMGIVYEAIDTKDNKKVALKVLLPHAAEQAEGISRFKREFRALARLRHPNVVRVYDAGIEDDTPFIAMEFLTGRDVRTYLRSFPEGGVRDRETVRILTQILSALGHIHARRIVHRDLKPENILITKDGRVKLMDFGVARMLRAPTSSSGLLGTFAYMAPEQVTSQQIDGRSDLYAIGVLLFELLTGDYPFPVEPPAAALHHHVNTKPSPVLDLNPNADRVLAELTGRLLEKDPVDRMQSAEEVLNFLARTDSAGSSPNLSASLPEHIFAPRLVGRSTDLKLLNRLTEDAAAGRGRLVLIEGPSGIGKTRLIEELRSSRKREMHVLIGQCAPERTQPYGAFTAILDAIASIASRVPKEVLQRIVGRDAALVGVISSRLSELGGPGSTDHLEPSERKIRLHKAAVGVVGRLALVKPVLVVVEDLHWADLLTLELLWDAARTLLAPRPGGEEGETVCPVSFLLTRRSLTEGPDHSQPLVRSLEAKGSVERLLLEPLEAPQVSEMVSTMTGLKEPSEAMMDELMEYTHGVPLMVQEVLHSWLNDQLLKRVHGIWYFRGEAQERGKGDFLEGESTDSHTGSAGGDSDSQRSGLPRRVGRDDVVLAKLRALDPDSKRLVERLALLGRLLPADLVTAVSDLQEEALLDAIDRLVRNNLLVEEMARDAVRYRFYHEGFREAVVRGLPKDVRASTHVALAERLERKFRSRRRELAHVLARHFRQGERPERATRYLIMVAENGALHGDLDGAMKRLDDALAGLAEAPDTPAVATRRLKVICKQIDILLDFGKAVEALDRALPQAGDEARDPHVMSGELLLRRAACQFALGRLDETLATLGRMPSPVPTRSLGARSLELEGRTRAARGEHTKARAVLEAARDIALSAALTDLEEDLEASIGIVMLHQGDLEGALSRLEDALERARRKKRGKHVAELIGHIGLIHFARSNTTSALSCFREALEIAEARGVRAERERWSGALGVLMTELCEFDEAETRLKEALAIAKDLGDRQAEATWRGELGVHYAERRQTGAAGRALNKCLAISREIGFLKYEAFALVHLAALQLEDEHKHSAVLRRLENGLEIAKEIGDDEIQVVGLFQLGRLKKLGGLEDEAQVAIDAAQQIASKSQSLRLKSKVADELDRLSE